jgi:hypothetical protein
MYVAGLNSDGNPIILSGAIQLYSDGTIIGGDGTSKYTVNSSGVVTSGIKSDNTDYISSILNQWSSYTGAGLSTLYYLVDEAPIPNKNPTKTTSTVTVRDSTFTTSLYFFG